MTFKEVVSHPFIADPVDKEEIIRQWKITTDHFSGCEGPRSLYHDMYASQGSNPSVNEELLLNILEAIRHVEVDDYPVFAKIPESQLCKNYVGIEASVAIPYDDANWSRDVLDISQRNLYEDEDAKEYDSQFHQRDDDLDSEDEWEDLKDARRRKRQVQANEDKLKSGHPGLDKDYQRFEICFFVKKAWSTKERQIFIAMQFGRWYQRGVIHFVDLIRVVDEIEEVLHKYVLKDTRFTDVQHHLPEAVYFASPRREIRFHPEIMADRATRYLQHIYVDVAVHESTNKTKLRKFEELMEGDPLEIPDGLATYQASVCFQDIDPQQFEELEAHMLGEIKCDGWEVDDLQRQADATRPETKIYKLLYERRRNWFNTRNDSSNEGQASNQARCEKIWGDFRRDYIFRFCTWADLPHQVDQPEAKKLWGDPFLDKKGMDEAIRTQEISEEDLLEKQLARTQIKQEKDVVEQFKRVEDVDLRQKALEQHKQGYQGQEGYYKLENQLSRGKGATKKKFDPLATPAAHGTRRIVRKH
uniref:Uncharacterized protein n=1 Tax=Panagrolaimus davidi TaxID=227884 RepID=A0A914R3S6_9BILA